MSGPEPAIPVDDLHRWVVERAEGEPRGVVLAEEVRRRLPLVGAAEVARTVEQVQARVVGMGPLDDLLADDRVTDVVVNGPGAVWVDRGGRLERTGIQVDAAQLDLLVERVKTIRGGREFFNKA